jgi:hypothetical protein
MFSVVYGGKDTVLGGKFSKKGKMWKLSGFVEVPIDPENSSAAWKKVARSVGMAEFRAISGNIAGASFFRFQSTAMDSAAQRGAAEFELSRHLLSGADSCRCQFCISGEVPEEKDGVIVNVSAAPEKGIEDFAENMRRASILADCFVHPFMAVDEELDTLYLPEFDPDFGYVKDSWMPMPDAETAALNAKMWLERLKALFILPDKKDFEERKFLPVLLVAEVIASGKLGGDPEASKVLPDVLRPVRFRGHLIVTSVLAVALIASLVWRFTLTYGGTVKEYREIVAETGRLKQKNSELKRSVKKNSKEVKDMTRLVETRVGEPDAIAEFAVFSENLPEDVMVSSIRWGETDIDVVVQCEDGNFDFDRHFRNLRYWKVTPQQGRQTADSAVATINLKLTPIEEAKPKK